MNDLMDLTNSHIPTLKVSVVMVTYGDRWHCLCRVLEHLENNPYVLRIVLIDNASKYSVADKCTESLFNKVSVYRNESNLGSAGGFARGISIACEEQDALLLLLDDDNLPRANAIKGLIDTYSNLSSKFSPDRLSVIAFRECQHGQFRKPIKPLFLAGHDFLNFNIFNALQRHLKLIKFDDEISSGPEFASFHRGGAYSGMMFSKALVQNIGLPKPDYILYFDDIDFVIRILNTGGVVWLDADSRVDDIVENCSISIFKIPILGFVLFATETEIYYIIRNRAYIDRYLEEKNSLPYKINKYVFLFLAVFFSLLLFKGNRVVTILVAFRHARQSRLGINPSYPLL